MSRKWRRIVVLLGVIVVASATCLWFFNFQAMMYFETRTIVRRAPWVKLLPRELPDVSVASAAGARLSYLGCQFEVPWDDLDPKLTQLTATRVVLRFKSGNSLVLTRVPPREYVDAVVGQMKRERFLQLFGEEPLKSDYALARLVLNSHPSQVTPFTGRKKAAGAFMLLFIKGIAMPEQSGIFNIRAEEMPGFQYGDPQTRPIRIIAHLFADDASFEFIFGHSKDGPFISQAEVNRVVQTLERTTAPDTTARR